MKLVIVQAVVLQVGENFLRPVPGGDDHQPLAALAVPEAPEQIQLVEHPQGVHEHAVSHELHGKDPPVNGKQLLGEEQEQYHDQQHIQVHAENHPDLLQDAPDTMVEREVFRKKMTRYSRKTASR